MLMTKLILTINQTIRTKTKYNIQTDTVAVCKIIYHKNTKKLFIHIFCTIFDLYVFGETHRTKLNYIRIKLKQNSARQKKAVWQARPQGGQR